MAGVSNRAEKRDDLFTRQGEPHRDRVRYTEKGRPFFMRERACGRCGGPGGSDKWAHTGWTCFDCGGSGKHKNGPQSVKLYTREELDKLNARAQKAAAKRAAKAAAKAKEEAERVEREQAAVRADNAAFIARARASGISEDGEGFLSDMLRNVNRSARQMTEAQETAAFNALDRIESEQRRRETATHVGSIGERVELELTEIVRLLDFSNPDKYWLPGFYIVIARTSDGNTVVYKGSKSNPFGFDYSKDECGKIEWRGPARIRATVKAHECYRDEPQTIVARPASLPAPTQA